MSISRLVQIYQPVMTAQAERKGHLNLMEITITCARCGAEFTPTHADAVRGTWRICPDSHPHPAPPDVDDLLAPPTPLPRHHQRDGPDRYAPSPVPLFQERTGDYSASLSSI